MTSKTKIERIYPVADFVRFWSQVKISTPERCWPYKGGIGGDGYGIFSARRSIRAHRLAFYLANGRFSAASTLHRCHNRVCCNPTHLYEGTAKDNMDDCIAAGRFKTVFVSGDKHPNTKLTRSKLKDVFLLLSLGHSQRSVAKRFNVTPGAIQYHRSKQW